MKSPKPTKSKEELEYESLSADVDEIARVLHSMKELFEKQEQEYKVICREEAEARLHYHSNVTQYKPCLQAEKNILEARSL